MAVASARNIVNLKEKGRFELENARINKYTVSTYENEWKTYTQ